MLRSAAYWVAVAVLMTTAILTAGCSGSTPTDAQIRSEIATALDASNISGVDVSVIDGVVTLTGTVPDQATADRVADIAKKAQGVKSVTSQLSVGGNGTPNDGTGVAPGPPNPEGPALVAVRVNQALIANPGLAGAKIVVTGGEGNVMTLTGTVPTDAAKAEAERVTKAVKDVASVVNQLQVVAAVEVATIPDDQLKDSVNAVIDQQFKDLSLFVQVEKGVVSLSGAVPDRGTIVHVSTAIHAVKGVKAVDTTRLTVVGNNENDGRIGAPATKQP